LWYSYLNGLEAKVHSTYLGAGCMIDSLEARHYTPWKLLCAYWQSSERMSAYLLLISVIVFSLILVGLDVIFTHWYNYFYNTLQEYDRRGALDLLGVFLFLASVAIAFSVYRYYLQSYLILRWRKWLTAQFMQRWLQNKAYYFLEHFNDQMDNPDQRIQEDIASFVAMSLGLVIGLLSSVVSFFAFIYLLWKLSGHLDLNLGRFGVYHLKGYLVWIAVLYASFGTFLTLKIGQALVPLNFEQQRREANFRFAAIDLRTHSEQVAISHAESYQQSLLNKIFSGVLSNWYAIILRQKLLMWFTAGYNQIAVIVPLVVAIPNYFNKVFKLGGLMQTLSAFQKIQDALSFIVNSYVTIAEWQAVIRRLLTFLNHSYEVVEAASLANKFIYEHQTENRIDLRAVDIYTPKGEKLLSNIALDLTHGKSYWLKGDSGIGKSILMRAMAGIWPFGGGEIRLPQGRNIMFIPQKNYMPIGSLKDALIFPMDNCLASDEELQRLLRNCDLPHLVNQLNKVAHWSENLSPGESQRIAFARVLLHKPDWVVLDESTSALDLKHEQHMYQLLKTQLPNLSIISVGHRPSLGAYHDEEINLMAFGVTE
jgi:putative ATP-binding cassette transporter